MNVLVEIFVQHEGKFSKSSKYKQSSVEGKLWFLILLLPCLVYNSSPVFFGGMGVLLKMQLFYHESKSSTVLLFNFLILLTVVNFYIRIFNFHLYYTHI